MSARTYTVLLYKNRETKGYSVIVPELPGCFSAGDSFEEALENTREAIELHLEGLREAGEQAPVAQEPLILASVEAEATV